MATSSPAPRNEDVKSYEIKIDLQGLIRLLAKNLYAEPDVFVRELIQNAHDSLKRRGELEKDRAPAGFIRIRTDLDEATISVTDNGSGLTATEIHDYLSTIGRSGTAEFKEELMRKGRNAEVTLIGQFGIGLLSAFVVAHRVEIETLSVQPQNPPWRWVSEGQKEYELGPGSRADPGTTVTLHITDNYRDMLDPDELRKAIRKYADFITYPIHLNDEEATANSIHAPWHRTYLNEDQRLLAFRIFVEQRFPDNALEVIPVRIEAPYRVDGVLYISDRRVPDGSTTGVLNIYQARMFITANNRDMLPVWAKFVGGVIDSPNLIPTAARDAIQIESVARAIRDALGRRIVEYFKDLAKRDSGRLERVIDWHSYHVKGLAVNHDDFFDAIADLVPFETNGGLMSLPSYLERSTEPNGQPGHDLVYFSEPGSANRFYMLCNAKRLLVIDACEGFDEGFLKKYAEKRPGIRLHQISAEGSQFLFEPLKADESAAFRDLEHGFRKVMHNLPSQATVARFKPDTLPAVIVLTKDAKLRDELKATRKNVVLPESVRKLADRVLEGQPTVPVTIYLNADNPTIQRMAKMARMPGGDSETCRVATLAIFHNAVLLAHNVITPEIAQTIFTSSNLAIKLMIDQTEHLAELQARLNAIDLARQAEMRANAAGPEVSLSDHITCMVALPFHDREHFAYETDLLPALREVLEQEPYFWQVVRADAKYLENFVGRNVATFMNRAHAYIAEISELNPNVMMELGYMFWAHPARDRPLLVLEREGTGQHLADLGDLIRIRYPSATGPSAVSVIAEALRKEFAKKADLQELNQRKPAHYLSPLLLRTRFNQRPEVAEAVSQHFPTIEVFTAAAVDQIRARVPALTRGLASGLREDIAELFRNVSPSQ